MIVKIPINKGYRLSTTQITDQLSPPVYSLGLSPTKAIIIRIQEFRFTFMAGAGR